LCDNTITTNEHLCAFSNVYSNIEARSNDTCMPQFVNSLEGRVAMEFFRLPNRYIANCAESTYWFKETFGSMDNSFNHVCEYNGMAYKPSVSIKVLNL
jgi:hypothetical protein